MRDKPTERVTETPIPVKLFESDMAVVETMAAKSVLRNKSAVIRQLVRYGIPEGRRQLLHTNGRSKA